MEQKDFIRVKFFKFRNIVNTFRFKLGKFGSFSTLQAHFKPNCKICQFGDIVNSFHTNVVEFVSLATFRTKLYIKKIKNPRIALV